MICGASTNIELLFTSIRTADTTLGFFVPLGARRSALWLMGEEHWCQYLLVHGLLHSIRDA